jgi:hypothetical protein
MSWWQMVTPGGQKMELVPGKAVSNNIIVSWNSVLTDILKTDTDYILSMHNDVIAHPQTLMRLLSWDKPLVSALVFMRKSPVVPHIWAGQDGSGPPYSIRIRDTMDWFQAHPEAIKFGPMVLDPRPEDALQEVDYTSTSCTLIHRSVLEQMCSVCGDYWFRWDTDRPNGGGEDSRFFVTARSVGFPAFVDRSCIVGHLIGEIAACSADFVAWSKVSEFEQTSDRVIEVGGADG